MIALRDGVVLVEYAVWEEICGFFQLWGFDVTYSPALVAPPVELACFSVTACETYHVPLLSVHMFAALWQIPHSISAKEVVDTCKLVGRLGN